MNQVLTFFNDNIIGIVIMFLVGLVFIVKGGDFFVDAASWLAEMSGIPKFIIGATVVSFATTMPELLTSLFATVNGNRLIEAAGSMTAEAQGYMTIAVGNAVGSVTANIGLIMGISLVCMPGEIDRRQFVPQAITMVAAAAVLTVFAPSGSIGMIPSIILIAMFAVFMYNNVKSAKRNMASAAASSGGDGAVERPSGKVVAGNIVKFIVGAALIVLGANMLVDYGTKIAEISGIPEDIIAITMIAIGTSLPELVTTVTAIAKKQSSLSVGNIIGANVFDLTLILSVCSFSSGGKLVVNPSSYMLDLPVCLAIGLIAVIPPIVRKRFYRWQGVVLLTVYAAYITAACVF